MMMKYILVVLTLLVKQSTCGSEPSCPPCAERSCERPKNCQGGVVKDACDCCQVCAKVEGELCGGKWMIEGQCDGKLRCVPRDRHHRIPWPNIGHCEPTACVRKKCGFRQECALNRRGQPHCVCPRNCRNRPVIPVCGYANGKQYNNDCELYRQECKSLREIGLMHGPCKKCVHKRRTYRFGDIRAGDKPCEKCACHHGEWTCKVRKSCQIHSCSEVRGRDGRKISTCLPGYLCKVQIPGIPAQNIPAVAACVPRTFTRPPVKATRKRPVFHPPARCLISSGKTGPCRARLVRWYFNPSRGKCLKFTYGGCGGNANSFFTKSSCRAVCKKGPNSSKVSVVPTKKPTTGAIKEQQICILPKKVGPCRAAFQRWYYNAARGRCVKFIYGGCGANANNFKTKGECDTSCPGRRRQVTGKFRWQWTP